MRLKIWLISIIVLLNLSPAFADVEILYRVLSETDKTAEVYGYQKKKSYTSSDVVCIPNAVEINGETYIVKKIGKGAFQFLISKSLQFDCLELEEIGAGALEGCHQLESITIPESVKIIGKSAFSFCDGLASVELPNSLTEIADWTFAFCKSLTSVNLKNVQSIGEYAFDFCESLTSVNLENVQSIGKEAFHGCKSLTSVNLENVQSIGKEAFHGCKSLTSVNLENVQFLGDAAFGDCGITSVEIPSQATSIGIAPFSCCHNMISITVDKDNPVYDSRNDCNAIIESKSGTLIMGCNSTTLPNDVTSIGPSAFSGLEGLTQIEIPNNVTDIGESAFYRCYNLASVILPENLTRIAGSTFYDCYKLKAIKIPENVQHIENHAFYSSGLNSIEIPNSVTDIGKSAFSSCSSLVSISLPCNLTFIPDDFCSYCTKLKSIKIPEGVTRIGYYAFEYCRSLATVELPSSLKMFMEYHCHDIHDTPFPLCDSIKRVVCHAIKPPTAIDPFRWAVYQNCQLVVPEGCEDAYRAASGWKKFYNIACDIPELADESMVDVYDLRGVMVRRKARVKDLEKELPKGVYVTHGKKFIVK